MRREMSQLTVGTSQSESPLANLPPEGQRELLARLLRKKVQAEIHFPMSVGQQGLWYAYRRDPTFTPFNVFLPTRICSPLAVGALRQAIEFLVQRHPCLRTTFSDDHALVQQHVSAHMPPEFTVEDASKWSGSELQARIQKETQRSFDLEHGPLLRLALFERGFNDWIILACTHHIAVDFWSLILLLSELKQIYPRFAAGLKPNLPALTGHYADFVRWQQLLLASPESEKLRSHWKRTLDGVPTVLELPTDFARPANFTGRAAVAPLEFPESIAERIMHFAAAQHTTPFAVVHAAVQVLLSRYSNQKSFLIGSPFSGRSHHKFEKTVGFFVNMLPLKADLADDPTFAELTQRFTGTLLHALEHQDYPFACIVRDRAPQRDPSRSPLFQFSCTFEKSQDRQEAGRAGFLFPSEHEIRNFGGLRQESFYVPPQTCHYDMEFIFELTESSLRGMVVYCRDLFAADSMQLLASNFQRLVSSLLDQSQMPISQVPWLPSLPGCAPPKHHRDSARTSLTQLWNGAVANHPDAVAIRSNDGILTYRELNGASSRVAKKLLASGIGREDLVPVCSECSPRVLAGILGVLQSGAGFVPIDIRQPAVPGALLAAETEAKLLLVDDLARHYAAEAGVPMLVVSDLSRDDRAPASGAPDRFQVLNSKTNIEPCAALDFKDDLGDDPIDTISAQKAIPSNAGNDLAYVIYTSGSTGKPKGVMIEHASICNTLNWRKQTTPLSIDDRVLMMLSHQFDAGLGIVFTTLTQGAELVWVDAEARHDIEALINQLIRDRITILPAPQSLLRLVVGHPRFKECIAVRQLWTGGECMPSDLLEVVRRSSNATLWNFYGPTEAAIEATAHELLDHDVRRPVPIGKPILNTHVLILDDLHAPVPDGVPGELAICGPGLARGYLKQPQLTAERFVLSPLDPSGETRIYITGDRGRRLADGNIEFLGRIDDQVKLHGYRLELGEIEGVLLAHPAVCGAAVKLCSPDSPHAKLVAFVTLVSSPCQLNLESQLRNYLAERLPAYKVPSLVQILDSLPLTSSGKVDRRKLPDVRSTAGELSQYVAPTTPLEHFLAELWQQSLHVERVGIRQNFFDLGGSSLQAAMLTTELSQRLGVHVPTALLFDLADISQIAQRLVQLHESAIADLFGMESITAYASNANKLGTERESTRSAAWATKLHALLSPLKSSGDRPPIFMVHPPGGIVICYRDLASHLPPQQPLIGIRARGLHGSESLPEKLQQMADEYIAAMRSYQPHGPYIVGGWSLGGIVALEMAQQLLVAGESCEHLLMLDTTIAQGTTDLVPAAECAHAGQEYGIELTLDQLSQLDATEQLPFLWRHAKNLGVLNEDTPQHVIDQVLHDLQGLFHHHVQLCNSYRIQSYPGSITLFRPLDVPVAIAGPEDRGWRRIAPKVDVRFVPGHHHSMVQPPHVSELARQIERTLQSSP